MIREVQILLLLFIFFCDLTSAIQNGQIFRSAAAGLYESVRPYQYSNLEGYCGCIDHHLAKGILDLKKGQSEDVICTHSLDLGLSVQKVLLDQEGVNFGDALLCTYKELKRIEKTKGCYALFNDGSSPWKISTISEISNNPASLCPPLQGTGSPTMVLGGFTMHRIKGDNINPSIDTKNKIAAIPLRAGSKVLDTCCGLGYTAIAAAKKVQDNNGSVLTIEYDDASLEMCTYNPYSQGLFDGTLPITALHGDSCEIIKDIQNAVFDFIIHDPPALAICSADLYGTQYYKELRRVLKPSGKMFHYIGSPSSKESGRLYSGITKRLLEAGFEYIQKEESAYGLVASL